MARITQVSLFTLVASCWLGAVGCSSSNEPSNNQGTSGSTSSAAGTGNTSTGGSDTGGNSSGGSAAIAGSGGSSTGAAGTGTAGAGGASIGSPTCAEVPVTAAGVAPTKAGVCTPTDTQLCYKTCGPQSLGFKSETCTNGAYLEGSACNYPDSLDASCYKIPTTLDASCPSTPPVASTACTVAACTPCNAGGFYLDSTMTMKTGYCVCPPPGASGVSKWSCASDTAWPCPGHQGCS